MALITWYVPQVTIDQLNEATIENGSIEEYSGNSSDPTDTQSIIAALDANPIKLIKFTFDTTVDLQQNGPTITQSMLGSLVGTDSYIERQDGTKHFFAAGPSGELPYFSTSVDSMAILPNGELELDQSINGGYFDIGNYNTSIEFLYSPSSVVLTFDNWSTYISVIRNSVKTVLETTPPTSSTAVVFNAPQNYIDGLNSGQLIWNGEGNFSQIRGQIASIKFTIDQSVAGYLNEFSSVINLAMLRPNTAGTVPLIAYNSFMMLQDGSKYHFNTISVFGGTDPGTDKGFFDTSGNFITPVRTSTNLNEPRYGISLQSYNIAVGSYPYSTSRTLSIGYVQGSPYSDFDLYANPDKNIVYYGESDGTNREWESVVTLSPYTSPNDSVTRYGLIFTKVSSGGGGSTDDNLVSPVLLPSGKVVGTISVNPTVTAVTINNGQPLPTGSLLKNASGQKYMKVDGGATSFVVILVEPDADWNWGPDGEAAWAVLQSL
jgi:hypothetical protein